MDEKETALTEEQLLKVSGGAVNYTLRGGKLVCFCTICNSLIPEGSDTCKNPNCKGRLKPNLV